MTVKATIRYKQDEPTVSTINHYQGMVDLKVPLRTPAEQARDKWMSNSYPLNYIVLIPLTIAKALMVNDAQEERIISQTSKFVETLRSDAFLEGIQLEFLHKNGGINLMVRYMLATPEADNRWSMRQTFNYTLPRVDESAAEYIATFLIDVFTSRRFLQNIQYEWFRGTGHDIHSHSRADSTILHRSISQLIQEDCQINLQRFPLILKAYNSQGDYAKNNGVSEAWSINRVTREV